MAQVIALSKVGAGDIKAWSADFPNAYKTIALRDASNDAATVCFTNPDDNKPYEARILVQPFGRRRAPANWGMVVTFVQFLACELLSLTVAAFVGDVFCDEPASASTIGRWAFKRLEALIGFLAYDKKGEKPTSALPILGDHVAIGDTSFCAAARPESVAKLRGHISQALRANCLTSAAASKLRGKLGFYTSLLDGKIGRGVMGPLIARQYLQRGNSLDTRLRRNLLWRYGALGNLPPRVTPYHYYSPVGAHTGAQGLGRISAVFTGENKTVVPTHLPVWFTTMATALPDESPVFIYELCASVIMARLALNWSRDEQRTCVLRGQPGGRRRLSERVAILSCRRAISIDILEHCRAMRNTLVGRVRPRKIKRCGFPLALAYSPQWQQLRLSIGPNPLIVQ